MGRKSIRKMVSGRPFFQEALPDYLSSFHLPTFFTGTLPSLVYLLYAPPPYLSTLDYSPVSMLAKSPWILSASGHTLREVTLTSSAACSRAKQLDLNCIIHTFQGEPSTAIQITDQQRSGTLRKALQNSFSSRPAFTDGSWLEQVSKLICIP